VHCKDAWDTTLLIGEMLAQKGFVTEAYLTLDMRHQWF